MSEKNGGPAFPEVETEFYPGEDPISARIYSVGGMSLRDYFAAAALQGFLAGGALGWSDRAHVSSAANVAYAIADAMLAEREPSE